jgi:hypothetical protein
MKALSPFLVAILCLVFATQLTAQEECFFDLVYTDAQGQLFVSTSEAYGDEYNYSWTVNGYFAGEGPVLDYIPPENGDYVVCLALQGPNCFWQDCITIGYDYYPEGCDFNIAVDAWGCNYYYFSVAELPWWIEVDWIFPDTEFTSSNFVSYIYTGDEEVFEVVALFEYPGCGLVEIVFSVDAQPCDECDPYFEAIDQGDGFYVFENLSTYDGEIYFHWYVNGEYIFDGEDLYYTFEPGTYEVCLELESGTCFDIYCETIVIEEGNCPTFINWTYQECNGVYMVLDAPIEGDVIWDMGDGNIITGGSILEYTYNVAGIYEVCAYYNGPDCTQGSEVCTTVQPYPCEDCEAYFDWTYEFGLLTTQNLSTYDDLTGTYWYIDGEYVGDSADLIYTLQPGVYQVCLQLESEFCFDEYCVTVVIDGYNCPTFLNWTYLDCNSVYLALDITVDYGVIWYMGDGTVLDGGSVMEYTYDEPGIYEVCAYYNGLDCTQGTEVCATVEPWPCEYDCEAYFEWNWVDGWLDAENLSEYDGTNVIFCWYIDGVFISYEEDLIYYLDPGEYEICLQVLTEYCEDWYCTTIVIDGDCSPCTFDVEITQLEDCVYQFEAIYPYDAEITWLLDDGTTLYGQTVTYTFSESGEHFACANLISEFCPNGTAACENFSVECTECGCPTYIAVDEIECGYYSFNLLDLTPPDGIYHWTFSNGQELETTAPIATMQFGPGVQYACVWIESEHCDADDELCVTLTVPECEDCFLDVSANFICENLGVFTAQTNIPNALIDWYFNGEYIASGEVLTWETFEPGIHELCATVESDLCDGLTQCIDWQVSDPCEALFEFTFDVDWLQAFNYSAFGGTPAFEWYIDGELVSTEFDLSIGYYEPGDHSLCLYIYDDCCFSEYCEWFTVEGECEMVGLMVSSDTQPNNSFTITITGEDGQSNSVDFEFNFGGTQDLMVCMYPGCNTVNFEAEYLTWSPIELQFGGYGTNPIFTIPPDVEYWETTVSANNDCGDVIDPVVTSPFEVYPNPADEVVAVKSMMEFGHVEFRNMTGEVALKTTIASGLMSIDTSALASGLYIVTIRNKQEYHTVKIEVVH